MADRCTPLVILDADGVFLDERPYWDAALGTAFVRVGLADEVAGRWGALADLAFGGLALQRVAKIRGCNSNWDLAAVLEHGLGNCAVREDCVRRLRVGDLRGALERLGDAADTLGSASAPGPDPLSAFGIDRDSRAYQRTRDHYQRVLFGTGGIDWRIEPRRLREPRATIVRAFESCRAIGFELRVCTGRTRVEIEAPLAEAGLAELLPSDRITSANEVERAEAATGRTSLGKPAAFPVLCAMLGFERALKVVEGSYGPTRPAASVYVGDGWSDFLAVRAARESGAELDYVHVRSPLVTAKQVATIEADPRTLGAIDRLGELPGLLERVPA